jgi:flagellar M-ring protein FliF
LLSGTQGDDALAGSSRQREYTRDLEADYQRRIENLLAPLVGAGKVRAGVTAELDFTQQEVTREDFDPTQQVVRSEQTSLDQRTAGAGGAEGVPGSLSNQPPGTVPLTGPGSPGAPAAGTPAAAGAANATTAAGAAGAAAANSASNVAQRSTRNFEIDRTISHVRNPVGNVRRLSVAVVIDNKVVKGADGKPVSQAVSAAELERYTALVRDVVGFDEQRGDRVQVLNETFQPAEPAGAAAPSEPLWSQPATQGYIRQGVAVLLVLLVVAFVLRPVMKGLFPAPGAVAANASGGTVLLAHRAAPGEVLLEPAAGRPGLPAPGAPMAALPSPQHFDQQVANARARVGQDPRRAAQVVKEWVAADG